MSRTPLLLLAAASAALLYAGTATQPATAGDAGRLQGVTHDVATRTTRVEPVRSFRSGKLAAARRALGRPSSTPEGARLWPEHRVEIGKVFGGDDREPVFATDAYPWSTVAKVFSLFPDGRWTQGSAVMVGPYQALTAGHVVYDEDRGGWADEVEVVPGYDFGFAPFGSYDAVELRSFAGWTQFGDLDYDVALVELDADAGDLTGWMGLAARSRRELESRILNTAGYPADLDDGEGMWFAADFPDEVTARNIHLAGEFDAAGGQSGSGVWVLDGEDRVVVGVLSSETRTSNVAVRITDEIFDLLDAWLSGFDGLADLAASNVGTNLPAEVLRGESGDVFVEIDNIGDAPATSLVEVFAESASGARTLLGDAAVTLDPDGFVDLAIPVSIPATLAAGEIDLVVLVNGDSAVAESDLANNTAYGPVLRVIVAFDEIPLGRRVKGRLTPGFSARLAFHVPAGQPVLKLRLTGLRGGFAIVERPDGSSFTLLPGSRNLIKEFAPLAGEWRVIVTNPPSSFFRRSYRFKAALRRR